MRSLGHLLRGLKKPWIGADTEIGGRMATRRKPVPKRMVDLITANEQKQQEQLSKRIYEEMYEYGVSTLKVEPEKARKVAEIAARSAHPNPLITHRRVGRS